uniref:Putative phosphohistidine phosphatase n=1 Tax=Magnetococcus massalia (strain MO-1) TaxID=451514 RepID=A0A1S7LEX3_MAGMO
MARHLILMRHAKSAWDTDVPTDFERPLAKRGRRDAPRMGKWMSREVLLPDHVVSSPAERARETIVAVSKVLDFKKRKINWDDRVYGASLEDLTAVLADVPHKSKQVLLVGHNPGLELLLSYLVGPVKRDSMYGFGMIKTATVVILQMPNDWDALRPGCASIKQIISPKDLKDKKDK